MEEYAKIGALTHLPILVRFYKLLNEVFAYKITQNEANTLTMPQVIEKIEREGGPQRLDTVLALKFDWNEFKNSWTGIYINICTFYIDLIYIFRNKCTSIGDGVQR